MIRSVIFPCVAAAHPAAAPAAGMFSDLIRTIWASMGNCAASISVDGLTYVCHKSVGHSGRHEDLVPGATWCNGDAIPARGRGR